MHVLVDLDEQERQRRAGTCVTMPALQPEPVVLLERLLSAQCIVNDDETRISVLKPAISFGSSVPGGRPRRRAHDPDEEVGREEGPEDHDLRDDEKQHPEDRGRRRARSGWPRAARDARGARARGAAAVHQAAPPPRCGLDVLDRHVGRARARGRRACRRPTSSSSSGSVEMTISEMWKYCDGVHDRRVRVGVADHAGGDDALGVVQRVEQLLEPLARLARPRSPAR